ncbi:PREDICTED: uncharacterized protein LOC104802078 [Tarenaya hassleriana]|uniref:uncharacterized protein LOC104802078 n=1 Tax=Tarenaya hassleriana TaxID=28532 RepID=UPI00053C407A|nr:PREDICTED: uncharacterized protein LOC104802078 [Tarenaya hassleriana]XP_010523826.1 PREDICTED: uncharacterized protein LOC104802078 [Tarenaya hassleriana]
MAQYQRLIIHHHAKKGERFRLTGEVGGGGGNGNGGGYLKRARRKILSLLFLALLSCCFVMAPHIFSLSSTFSLLDSVGREGEGLLDPYEHFIAPHCSGISNGTICCDRTNFRSDICIMKGDVRTHSASSSVFLFTSVETNRNSQLKPEKIKPYTRKWETSVMDTVQELSLPRKDEKASGFGHVCDVYHDVPAVFFSTGGYTGNVYHEFNDGIIPLYVTSQHFKKRVVFVITEYRNWWMMKYGDVLSQLSGYPPVDFSGDSRTHCFKEAIVGLRIHDELTVDPLLMPGNKTIVDFRNVLDTSYWPRIRSLIQDEEREAADRAANQTLSLSPLSDSLDGFKKPKLVILSRNGSRAILNENLLVELAEGLGFLVEVLRPDRTTELAKIYRSLNSSHVTIGVHGAAMTHFLFLKPETVFVQIIPIGTDWAAETYYGEPAKKLGLKYIPYKIKPTESSLYGEYDQDDPIIRNPKSFTRRGWEYTKKIYLERQNVNLDLTRFGKILSRAYDYSILRITPRVPSSLAA